MQTDFVDFAQLIQCANDAIFSTDEFLVIKSWNTAAEELYGFTAKEAIGTRMGKLLKSTLPEENRAVEFEMLQRLGSYKGEYGFYNKRGDPIYVQASITVLRDTENKVSGYVAIHQNISDQKRVEERLKIFNSALQEQVVKKTAQLTSIFERITDAFVAVDNKGFFTYMNKKAGEVVGKDPVGIIGKYLWDEFPEAIGQEFSFSYEEAKSQQKYVHFESYYEPYQRWFDTHIYPSKDGVSIFFRDITAQRSIEKQAKMSNQRLFMHLNNSPLAVVEWDINLIVTSWSTQAEEIFGWTDQEAIGKPLGELRLVHQEDHEDVQNMIGGLLSGSAARFKSVNRNYTKTGRVIYCEWYNSVLKDDNGTIISGMSLVQDITEKKKAEEALALDEEQLNLIYNSGSDILFLLQVEGERYRFISVNEAFKVATGLVDDQILNKYVEEVIPPPSSSLVISKYEEAVRTRQPVYWEEVTEYPVGEKIGRVSVTPVYDSNGVCIRLVGSVHDITASKAAEAELKEKNEQLRNLSAHLQEVREEERANIAREIHDELGERLTGIRLDISWLQNHIPIGSKKVHDKFPDLLQLVDDTIKTVRKISSDLRPSILDDFGLVDALEWQAMEFEKRTGINCLVKSFLKKNINNKKIDITLFRIFQESLTNVVRHARAENVNAQLLEHDNQIEFIITDDGIGMRLDEVHNKKTLGLIGMKERVLMVDGEYSISSEPGKGTSIIVTVPAG